MVNVKRVGSLSVLAGAGLGIGAALLATPGVALAKTSPADGGAGALGVVAAFAAADVSDAVAGIGAAGTITPPTIPADYANFAISFSGIPLYQSGTAFAVSNFGNFAIAHGDGAMATAWHGLFNYASSTGDHSVATAGYGGGSFNTATVVGENSAAYAGWVNGITANGNVARVTGDFSSAYAGVPNGGIAGGSFNTSIVEGAHSHATTGLDGSSNNVASAIGDETTAVSPAAAPGDATDWWTGLWNYAFGDNTTDLSPVDGSIDASDWWTGLWGLFTN